MRSADGSIRRDETGRAPGRGTYVCNDPACRDPERIAAAVKRVLGTQPTPRADLEVNANAPT